jgi:hypothetical protein
MSHDLVIGRYVSLRDKKKALEKAHKEELQPINEALLKLEIFLLKTLQDTGLENMRSKAGTAFKAKTTSVTLADKPAYLQFIIDNELWELLDVRPLKTAVEQYKEDHDGALPPGVTWREELTVNVRKPT